MTDRCIQDIDTLRTAKRKRSWKVMIRFCRARTQQRRPGGLRCHFSGSRSAGAAGHEGLLRLLVPLFHFLLSASRCYCPWPRRPICAASWRGPVRTSSDRWQACCAGGTRRSPTSCCGASRRARRRCGVRRGRRAVDGGTWREVTGLDEGRPWAGSCGAAGARRPARNERRPARAGAAMASSGPVMVQSAGAGTEERGRRPLPGASSASISAGRHQGAPGGRRRDVRGEARVPTEAGRRARVRSASGWSGWRGSCSRTRA